MNHEKFAERNYIYSFSFDAGREEIAPAIAAEVERRCIEHFGTAQFRIVKCEVEPVYPDAAVFGPPPGMSHYLVQVAAVFAR